MKKREEGTFANYIRRGQKCLNHTPYMMNSPGEAFMMEVTHMIEHLNTDDHKEYQITTSWIRVQQ